MHKPASRAANQIQELFEFGIDYKTIARLAGVYEATLDNIRHGKAIKSTTEQKILGVKKAPVSPRHQPKGDIVSPEWAGIHLRKLKLHGVTNKAIAKASSVSLELVQRIASTKSRPIFERTERRLLAVSLEDVRKQPHWKGRMPEATRAAMHCRTLLAKGVTLKQIARASGVDYGTLKRVMNGQKRVFRETQKRILSTTHAATISQRTILPSQPFFRLVHDLRKRFGFSYRELSRRLGGYNVHKRSKGIRFENAVKIMGLHDELTRPIVIVHSRGRMKSSLNRL